MTHILLAIVYIAFISLGLPDALLGSAWPTMYPEMGAPVSYAGIVSMIISGGTILSSLLSDRLSYRFSTQKVTAVSVGLTALALLGFSVSRAFWMLCLFAIPYGLGAGAVDAGLNNYVALHYSSRHMSWLHCMWGVGASMGPMVMGAVLTGGQHWSRGYQIVGLIQVCISLGLFLTLPLWKKANQITLAEGEAPHEPIPLRELLQVPGVKPIMLAFFCYCGVECTTGLWAGSYLVLHKGVAPDVAAQFCSLFFIGVTLGRALNGFLTVKLSDRQLIRIGTGVVLLGLSVMLLPLGQLPALAGFLLVGVGCAPVFPCIIHSTPYNFGAHRAQSLIGVQMASANAGICLMPPLFGLIANHITVALLPVFLLVLLVSMILLHEWVLRICRKSGSGKI